MRRIVQRRSAKGGLPPGTLVHIGERKADETKISVMTYDEQHVQEQAPQTVEQCLSCREWTGVTWINVDGTMIRVIMKDQVAFVGIDIFRSDHRIKKDSEIVIGEERLCVGDEIRIDGMSWKIHKLSGGHNPNNFALMDEEVENRFMKTAVAFQE